MNETKPSCFNEFNDEISHIPIPKLFTFPFYYEPNPLCLAAVKQVQNLLVKKDFDHDFGLNEGDNGEGIGKMFGVLIIKTKNDEIGYLSAFSGKLAGKNHHKSFVPPVFDILTEEGFYRKEEKLLNTLNIKVEKLEQNPDYLISKNNIIKESAYYEEVIATVKKEIKRNKEIRDSIRKEVKLNLTEYEYGLIHAKLALESANEQYELKKLVRKGKEEKTRMEMIIIGYQQEINALKEIRKEKSAALQQQLFEQYYFLNQAGEMKSLGTIFHATEDQKPPAGAGECAAPKLLQYAFLHNLKPIALTEFWWGKSPNSDIKKHGQFYPACRGKCEPILKHMLAGIDMDENPLLKNPSLGKELPIIYEDEYLAIVNKPSEFLSVPGKSITDSVYERVKMRYPNASGPLIVHRLDMSTSGLMLIAKTKEIHKHLQSQFLKRTIKKRYVALLEGIVKIPSGEINLPLRVDIDDRPRQLVCYEYGKPALTHFETFDHKNRRTKVYFYPITGRTHQLRVHAAHQLGLNTPIVGDDLYGTKGERLHLHAERIVFQHPVSKEVLTFQADAEF
jgi:tRNA pseudouridine32 synthase/23S rRNA pseudouridine746 synthase